MDEKLKERLRLLRHIALDMDGTIYLGSQLFDCTLPFLKTLDDLGITFSFLTNNPTRSLEDYIGKLHRLGVPCRSDQMYSTATASIEYILSHHPSVSRLFVLGTPSMQRQFRDAGFILTQDSADDVPQMVVLAFDTTLTYSRLCRLCWWVSKGLPYIATNPDWVCPTDEPTILVDCGSLMECVRGATGRRPDLVIGKPNPAILETILEKKGLKPCEAAMVGDRLYTDVDTALRAGSMGILTLSGESTMETVRNSKITPSLIVRDVGELRDLLFEAFS